MPSTRPAPELSADMSLGDVVAMFPAAARVFAQHRIDFCCGGGRTVGAACRDKQLEVDDVFERIRALDAPVDEPPWQDMTPAQMCDALESRFHRPLDSELPRLSELAEKVARVHGDRVPALREVAQVYAALRSELTLHMAKEEQVLFPMIRTHGAAPPPPIRCMRHEHDDAGDALKKLRALCNDYEPPEDACNSYRALMAGLAELESELHLHIHVENNVLFPRVMPAPMPS